MLRTPHPCIHDGSIVIKGSDITLDASGKINAKSSGDMALKGSKIGSN
jgi:type VI secretion system secreted protein VgrG